MVKQEVRRVIFSPFFCLGIIVLVACHYIRIIEDIPNNNDIFYLLETSCHSFNRVLIPLLSGLATADSYLVEKKSGYYYAVISRTERLKYCMVKVGIAILSGMAVVLLSKLIFLISIALVVKLMHGEISNGEWLLEAWSIGVGEINPDAPYFVREQHFWLFTGQIILYDCLYASIFPAMAFAVSVFCSNKYIVLLSSYIYAEAMGIVFIGLKLFYVSPSVLDYCGRASLLPHEGLPFRIAVVMAYWGLEILIFLYGMDREMEK